MVVKLEDNGAYFASLDCTNIDWGIVMKTVYPMASVVRLEREKLAKSKTSENISQRYVELLRLRGQVHELEAQQRSSEYRRTARSARSPAHQPGIV
jgi:hypothetical protein